MIEILKWSDCFESADTRKRQRLGWFLAPSGCDSRGFRKLMRMGKDGLIALGFFQALCQSMATLSKETRQSGIFQNSDGKLMELDDILELSRVGGMQVADYQQITGRLVSVGWIRLHNSLESQQSASHLPPVCQSSPSFVQGEGEGEGQEEGKEEASTPPKKPKREISDEGYKFADWFKELLPESVRLSGAWRDSYADAYDSLVRIDKRAPEQIREVCEWARADLFWQAQFLSPLKLRDRKNGIQYFDAFLARMNQPKPQAKPAGGKHAGINNTLFTGDEF